jgi:hypothetical protein
MNADAVAEDIVHLIVSGKEDLRLKWSPSKDAVQVLTGKIPQLDGPSRTREGRLKRLRGALEAKLLECGWKAVRDTAPYTYRIVPPKP